MTAKNQQISALIDLNEDLENYFSNTIIPQLFVDAQLILRKFTPPAMKHFKLEAGLLGMPFEGINGSFRFSTIIEDIKTVMDTGKILEKEIQTVDMRWYELNILPYFVRKENRILGVILSFVDITARVNALRDQEKLISEHELLLDTIAHDIQNPILALGLTIQVLKKLPERGMDNFPVLLQNIENSLLEMKKVVGDLNVTRWQKKERQSKQQLLDLHHIMEGIKQLPPSEQIEKVAFVER